ncbi:hypothetical protein ACTXT7_004012 [Hymenolepis weldensis]
MISTRCSLLAISIFALFFILAESRVRITECPSGTATCSHGTCLQALGRDDEGRMVNDYRCFCDPKYHGEACTVQVDIDFSNPKVISPADGVRTFSFDWFSLNDPVNEKHSFGGGV